MSYKPYRSTPRTHAVPAIGVPRDAMAIDAQALATIRRILIQSGELALARSYVPTRRR